jgi:hypothetical protein
MRGDDDGFVDNPKKIMRMVGSNEDDMKVLVAKKFILPFEIGVCVIKHWKIHNYIQNDRYKPTRYSKEMAQLIVKDNGGYKLDTDCIQNGNTGKDRLGKVSLDKKSEIKKEKPKEKTTVVKFTPKDMEMAELLVSLIKQNNPAWQLRGNIDVWAEHIEKLHRIDNRTYEQIEVMIRWTQQDPFWSQNILSTAKLREKFNDLIPRLKKVKTGRAGTKVNF